jgi:transcriptional regulator with XRE-family HTH domain
MALNENITRRRVAVGLSRREVAKRLGVTERQWWRMETDRIKILASEMPRIAAVLGTTIARLYRESRRAPASVDEETADLENRRCPQRGRRTASSALAAALAEEMT